MNLIKRLNIVFGKVNSKVNTSLITLMILAAIVESFSIGLVIPVFTIIIKGKLNYKLPFFHSIYNLLGQPSYVKIIALVITLIMCFYIFKALFLLFVTKKVNKFVYGLEVLISEKLYESYLARGYSFFLKHDSVQLIRNVYHETKYLSIYINHVLNLLSEGFVVLLIGSIIIYFQPIGAIFVIAFFGIVAFIFLLVTQKKNEKLGLERKKFENLRLKFISDAFGNIKDIKLYGKEDHFLAKFKTINEPSSKVSIKHATLLKLPSIWLEVVAILGLTILIISLELQFKRVNEILPILGLFAVATFRLLPSINRISTSYQAIKFYSATINSLFQELENIDYLERSKSDIDIVEFSSYIEFENVNYYYDQSENLVLNNFNFKIEKGDFIGLIGPSGSGKSTFVDIFIGLLQPKSGKIFLDNRELKEELRNWQNQIGYVSQSIQLIDDTILNNIAFGINEENLDQDALEDAICKAQLVEFIESQKDGIYTIVGEKGINISGGQRQRIVIARALYHKPSVLVFDEATNALDKEIESEIMNVINQLKGKTTILIVTHQPSLLVECNRVYKLKDTEFLNAE